MSAPVSLHDVSKAYNLYASPRDVVKEALLGGIRHDVFWALRHLSLEVAEGQRVAVIGPNGAGKSTLLKLVSGNLTPTSGSVRVDGRVSAMLSLTSFLQPEETGLENIRFNLIANGARRADLPRLTEEIVEFTELGAFIHTPVRTYSTGMNARLAFAISTAIEPDILVVDEVLSVGDAHFAAKATLRMINLCNEGRALLFVSHDMGAVQLLCNTAVWLDEGQVREIGPVAETARRYEADFRRQEDERVRPGNRDRRTRLLHRVLPEDVARPDITRLRLIGPEGRTSDTHYVRNIVVSLDGDDHEVGLDRAEPGVDGPVALDLLRSEWGRLHTLRGIDTRTLTASSRPLRGGHVLVRLPGNGPVPVSLTFESSSILGTEELVVETIDPEAREWRALELSGRELESGWRRLSFTGMVSPVVGHAREPSLERLVEEARPDIEILGATMRVEGEQALSVREGEPFAIAVHLRVNRAVPLADVALKLVRSDGVYVFWQSSSQAGVELKAPKGEKVVTFRFDPNVFGAGDYEVTVEVANGFDPRRNFPYSEVYDRDVAALEFTVTREWPLVMFGPVNVRFPVSMEDA